jgi:hypothetical protein
VIAAPRFRPEVFTYAWPGVDSRGLAIGLHRSAGLPYHCRRTFSRQYEVPAMTMNCKSCGRDKPEAEMFTRKGKPIRTCRECRAEQFKVGIITRAKTMRSVQISRSVTVEIPTLPPAAAFPMLDILPGWGVNAALDDGRLVLKQSDSEGNTDEISLSQSEARTLFAHFSTWAA